MSTMETPFSRSGPLNPPGTAPAAFEAWQARLAPGDIFRHPREVVAHPGLSRADKRAILASWASDACALEGAPALRCLPGARAEPVCIDAVLAALAELDRIAARETRTPVARLPTRRPRWRLRGRRDDDDDPPPYPSAAMPRPWTPPRVTRAVAMPA